MRNWAVSLCSILLAACATAPAPRSPDGLFNDRLFLAPSERISAGDVFALSDEMKRYLDTEIAHRLRSKGARQGLVDAVAKRGELKLEYDSLMTRNAAQAFAARSGNCLSLVIMTAAFAKALDLPVRYQSVLAGETVSRSGDIQYFIGHINLTLGEKLIDVGPGRNMNDLMTIDFLPPEEVRGLSTRAVGEDSIVAMFMNNRAAEALARGQIDDAYWWARGAIGQDPRFVSAYNTLGIVYRRHGNLLEAEKAFAYVLEREPGNTRVMSNLVRLLNELGRVAEAKLLANKLALLEPNPPFAYFDLGMTALRDGNPGAAKDLFTKEVDRAPYYHEFRYWLGVAYLRLGDTDRARKQLTLATEYATTRNDHDLYAAKLDRIRSSRLQ
jgi:Flp pilus assembly protein TadD